MYTVNIISTVSELVGGIERVQSQYDLLYFQEFCISSGGGEGPNAYALIYRFSGILQFQR